MFTESPSSNEPCAAAAGPPPSPGLPSLDDCARSIDTEYRRLGHALGWRFVTGPAHTFASTTEFALITLNPAGRRDYPEHPSASSEAGSSYWAESWDAYQRGTAPLQRQIQLLFAAMASTLGVREPVRDWVESSVLTANFVPFRSSRFAHLHRPDESIAFSRGLWSRVLAHWTPRTILTIDNEAFAAVRDIVRKEHGFRIVEERSVPTGWGTYRAETIRLVDPGTGRIVTLGRLPHLSTFKLFSRPACEAPVRAFLRYLTA
jgi:hypothetical protein